MLKFIVTCICVLPFIMGFIGIVGLFIDYFSDDD